MAAKQHATGEFGLAACHVEQGLRERPPPGTAKPHFHIAHLEGQQRATQALQAKLLAPLCHDLFRTCTGAVTCGVKGRSTTGSSANSSRVARESRSACVARTCSPAAAKAGSCFITQLGTPFTRQRKP